MIDFSDFILRNWFIISFILLCNLKMVRCILINKIKKLILIANFFVITFPTNIESLKKFIRWIKLLSTLCIFQSAAYQSDFHCLIFLTKKKCTLVALNSLPGPLVTFLQYEFFLVISFRFKWNCCLLCSWRLRMWTSFKRHASNYQWSGSRAVKVSMDGCTVQCSRQSPLWRSANIGYACTTFFIKLCPWLIILKTKFQVLSAGHCFSFE